MEEQVFCFGLEAVIADQAADDGPVFPLAPPARAGVFDMSLVVLLVGTRTGESDLFGKTILVEQIVDKLIAIV